MQMKQVLASDVWQHLSILQLHMRPGTSVCGAEQMAEASHPPLYSLQSVREMIHGEDEGDASW